MLRLFAKIFYGLSLAALTAGSVLAAAGAAASSASEHQGLTRAGWLMLIPGLIAGAVVLYLAATAPMWRKRHLHHW